MKILRLIPKSIVVSISSSLALGASVHTNTELLFARFATSQSLREVEQTLDQSLTVLQSIDVPTYRQQETYQVLMQELVRYETVLKCMMIHPKTGSCCYSSTLQQRVLVACGYYYYLAWAKKNQRSLIIDFYRWYWCICSYLFCSAMHDLQVTTHEYQLLLKQTYVYLKTLRSILFHLEQSLYYPSYAHLLDHYQKAFDLAKKQSIPL